MWPGICEDREKMKRRDFKYLGVTEQCKGAGGNPATGMLAAPLCTEQVKAADVHVAHITLSEIHRCTILA